MKIVLVITYAKDDFLSKYWDNGNGSEAVKAKEGKILFFSQKVTLLSCLDFLESKQDLVK